MTYTVGQVARLAGVTVRTLHHYGQIGLLEPGDRTASGYRHYSEPDLDRLRTILFYRELGFSLDDIAAILVDPGAGTTQHLQRQRSLLVDRIRRLEAMVASVDKEMEGQRMGTQLTPEEKFEIFGPNYSEDYETEAEQRWGDTDAWRQSQERTSRFGKDDWVAVKAAGDDLNRRMAAALRAGVAPDSEPGMDLAEEHHAQLQKFYDAPYAMHRGLADMYLADDRFTRTYEQVAPGLTQWLHDAIHANADRFAG